MCAYGSQHPRGSVLISLRIMKALILTSGSTVPSKISLYINIFVIINNFVNSQFVRHCLSRCELIPHIGKPPHEMEKVAIRRSNSLERRRSRERLNEICLTLGFKRSTLSRKRFRFYLED